VRLYDEGRYEEALEAFTAAHGRAPRAIFLYNAGRCRQKLGRLEEARETFLSLLARADLLSGRHAAYRDKARAALAEVEQAIADRKPPPAAEVRIAGGSFRPAGGDGVVNVAPFAIDVHEVDALHYRFCVRSGACPAQADTTSDPLLPARDVTWAQADAYCRFAGRQLPTEAQWELAARGGGERPAAYPWGDAADCSLAVLACSGAVAPQPPGGKPTDRTPDGVLDLGGNVSEWVADWFGDVRTSSAAGPESGTRRVVRGGSFRTRLRDATTDARYGLVPGRTRDDVGFRCARPSP
jgi:formylglycine-generating enzyme required for sulfatase activity